MALRWRLRPHGRGGGVIGAHRGGCPEAQPVTTPPDDWTAPVRRLLADLESFGGGFFSETQTRLLARLLREHRETPPMADTRELSERMAVEAWVIDAGEMMIESDVARRSVALHRSGGSQQYRTLERQMTNALIALEKLGYTVAPPTGGTPG